MTKDVTAKNGLHYKGQSFENHCVLHGSKAIGVTRSITNCPIKIFDFTSEHDLEFAVLIWSATSLDLPLEINERPSATVVIAAPLPTSEPTTTPTSSPTAPDLVSFTENQGHTVTEGDSIVLSFKRTRIHGSRTVYCIPEQWTATAGVDFVSLPKKVVLADGESTGFCEIQTLLTPESEFSERFRVKLVDVRQTVLDQAVVIIKDSYSGPAVWPTVPIVTGSHMAGSELNCVTCCEPEHPDFTKTKSLCEGISPGYYEWQHKAPNGRWTALVKSVSIAAFPVDQKLLDQAYVKPGVEVRCTAFPRNIGGSIGVPSTSQSVVVSSSSGTCNTAEYGAMIAERFEAHIEHTGFGDYFTITALIPASDGM